MELTVINSGSKANCYVLQNEAEALIIECGCPVQEALLALKFNSKKVVGCIITHRHLDHMRYVEDFLNYFPCYCSQGTIDDFTFRYSRRPIALQPLKTVNLGGFSVRPFDVQHDAPEPFGFLIKHDEIGTLMFATDTYYIKYKFEGLTKIMVECNYDLELLRDNVRHEIVPFPLEQRTLQSHMSLEHCKQMLQATDLRDVTDIVLLHLSANNAEPQRFKKEIELLTGIHTTIAQRGVVMPFNKTPF